MQLMVLRAFDGMERELTDGRFLDQRPALSPDGSQVAFVSDRGGGVGLWTLSIAGGEPVQLVTGRPVYRPWWSVDGRRIYFFLLGPGRHRVHWVPTAGGSPVPLENDDRGDTHGPYADPNGRDLLVHSTREGERRTDRALWGLFEMPLDGGPARRLDPPGHDGGAHATRARNGILTFDVSRRASESGGTPRFR
jgi:Tol biopolymer transport system component